MAGGSAGRPTAHLPVTEVTMTRGGEKKTQIPRARLEGPGEPLPTLSLAEAWQKGSGVLCFRGVGTAATKTTRIHGNHQCIRKCEHTKGNDQMPGQRRGNSASLGSSDFSSSLCDTFFPPRYGAEPPCIIREGGHGVSLWPHIGRQGKVRAEHVSCVLTCLQGKRHSDFCELLGGRRAEWWSSERKAEKGCGGTRSSFEHLSL